MKPYYIANPEHMDTVYSSGEIVCIDAREVRRLAREWDMDPEELFSQLHEADESEIAEYGTYGTPLTDTEFSALWADAPTVSDREAYVSDWALSSIWGDPEEAEIPEDRLAYLSRLWELAHMNIREICAEAHITMTALSVRTTIPYRTLQNWASGTNRFPGYDRLLILHYLGLMPNL